MKWLFLLTSFHFSQASFSKINPLRAKFMKWSNTLKQIVGKLPTICLSVFDDFSGLALKGLSQFVTFWYFVTKKLERTLFGIEYCGRVHLKVSHLQNDISWSLIIHVTLCQFFSSTHHSPVSFTKTWQTMA